MRLRQIHIEHFGCLHDFNLKLEDGLTVLREDNGFGKTTLAEFVRAMFYGFPRASRGLDKNKRKKYLPWDGSKCGGYLIFTLGEECYRLERTFGTTPRGDTFSLIDLRTNRRSNRFSEEIGLELFGLDAESFERSTYLPQIRETGSLTTDSIAAKLGDLVEDSDDVGNFDKAMGALRNKRSGFVPYRGSGGTVARAGGEITRLQEELEGLENSRVCLEENQGKIAVLEAQLEDDSRRLEMLRQEITKGSQEVAASAVRQQYENLLALRRLEEEKLDARFEKRMPGAEEFARAEQAREEYRMTCISGSGLSQPEQLQLRQLEDFFAGEVPEEEQLEALSRQHHRLLQLQFQEEHQQMTCGEQEELSRLEAFFGSAGVADPAPYREKLERAKRLRSASRIQRDALEKTERKRRIAWILLGLAALLMCAGAVVGAVLKYVPAGLALSAVGALALLAGLVCRLSCGNTGKLRSEAENAEKEAEGLEGEVAAFLSPYPVSGAPEVALEELREKAERYLALGDRSSFLNQQRQKLFAERKIQENTLASALKLWFGDMVDFDRSILELRIKRSALLELRQKQAACAADGRQQEHRAKELEGELLTFLVPYCGQITPADISAALPQLRRAWDGHIRTQNRIRELDEQIAAFRNRYGAMLRTAPAEVLPLDQLKQQERELAEEMNVRTRLCLELKQRSRQLQSQVEQLPRLADELESWQEKKRQGQQNADTLDSTMEFLQKARDNLAGNYMGSIRRSFEELLEFTAGEEKERVLVTQDLEVLLERQGQARELASFSAGQTDLVMLCMRFALVEGLFRQERPFLILDDPFVNLDDARTAQAMELLRRLAGQWQILYLTCNSSRT